jgi:hemolysin activation/secretion protein
VKKFVFVGNTVFSQSELQEVVEDFRQRPLTFVELLAVRTRITEFYTSKGYVTSGAYLPPQTIKQGVVEIRILEGRLEDIRVKVQGRLNSAYIRDRLAIAAQAPLNVNRLLEALQILQLNPLIANISAELSTGTTPGTNILNVEVKVARTFSAEAIFDNGRSPAVGEFRRGIQLTEANLLGLGDSISAWYLNTDGSNDWDLSYSIPINAYNGEVGFQYRNVTSRVTESPLDVLDIESRYQDYQVSFRQPVYQTPRQEVVLGVTFDHQKSSTRLGGEPLAGIVGADNQGRTNISTLRLSQEWTRRTNVDVLALRSEFSLGLQVLGTTDSFDAQINPLAPSSNYALWRGDAQWVRLLAPDTLFVFRSNIQLTTDPLVSLEQFGIGGLNSVRGYRQNFLLSDNGVFASAEFRLPIYRQPRLNHVLQVVPFVDVGRGWNVSGLPTPENQTLASVGIGLNWQYSDIVSARLDWGLKLIPIDFSGDTLQDNGFTFSIIIRPFP